MNAKTYAKLLLSSALVACSSDPAPTIDVKIPNAPGGVTVSTEGDYLLLEWNGLSEDEDAFVIARAELASADATFDASSLAALTTVTADKHFLRDQTVQPGVFYAYGVAARNTAGDSEYVLQSDAPTAPEIAANPTGPCVIAVPSDEDKDGDGLSDEVETTGWRVRVDEDGQGNLTTRNYVSDPLLADTDDDGVCDATEQLLRTNPTRSDTDADGLTDREELEIWGSSPIGVDSDGDANGNTAFFDGAEIERYGTSPTLADSDGDGRSDFDEINQNGTNPLLADLPQPEIRLVGTMDLGLNVELANGTTQENAFSSSFEESNETSVEQTNSTATTVTTGRSAEVSASVGASFPDGASLSVEASYTRSEGLVRDASRSFSQGSRSSAQRTFAQATERAIERTETIVDGTLAMQVEIVNGGRRTFELNNLVLTAFTRSRDNPASFLSIATLPMPAEGRSVTLSENDTAGPFRLEANIAANVALDLLANPSGIFFRPAGFSLADRTGQNFEFTIGETTNNRTALLTIDYGGGRPVETYRVATNVMREDGGRLSGLTMADALTEIVGLDATEWETAPNAAGRRVLTRIHDVETEERAGGSAKFWAVIASENGTSLTPVGERLLDPSVAFEDLVLMPRDRVYLAYVSDEDGDGLFAREERVYGTADTNVDSDGDGRTDFEEIRESWVVFNNLPYYAEHPRVFSNPTIADVDQDGLDDAAELAAGTDPNRADTDGDGVADGEDGDPLRGLQTPKVFAGGTSSYEFPFGVEVDSRQNMIVIGQTGGDFDNDGFISISHPLVRSRFIASYAPSGDLNWVKEFESLPEHASSGSVVVTETDEVVWMDQIAPNDLGGVSVQAPHLVRWDREGNQLAVERVTWAGNQGVVDDMKPFVFEPLPSGGFAALGARISSSSAVVLLIMDEMGRVTAGRTWSNREVSEFRMSVTPMDEIILFDACTLRIFDRTASPAGTVDFCADTVAIQAAYIDVAGDVYAASTVGTLYKRTRAGASLWTFTPPATTGLYPSALDRLGRFFGMFPQINAPTTVRSFLPNGALSFEFTLPRDLATWNAATVDRDGNFYLVGYTDDGAGGLVRNIGADDLIVMRNPHLLFGP